MTTWKTPRATPIRTLLGPIALLVATGGPVAAQQGPPAGAPAPPPEAVERLDRVRMERMREALDLTENEITAIRSRMERHRTEMRRAMVEQRDAMERLQRALRDEPVDQQEVARALEAVERERERIQVMRDEHRDEIGQDLSPEKRARMMLFNQRFESRLRELMARHRAPGVDRPGPGRAPGVRRPRPGVNPRRGANEDLDAEQIRHRIERLEAEIDRLRSRLDEP